MVLYFVFIDFSQYLRFCIYRLDEEEDGACLSVPNFCRLLEEGSTNCKHFCLKVKVSPDSDTAEKVDTRRNGLNVNGLILK